MLTKGKSKLLETFDLRLPTNLTNNRECQTFGGVLARVAARQRFTAGTRRTRRLRRVEQSLRLLGVFFARRTYVALR